MRFLFTAGPAFVLAALLTGHLTPAAHWQAVRTDLHRAQPLARMKAELETLFHPGRV